MVDHRKTMRQPNLLPILLPILLTALTLGTTWAIRGQFGHEQGAAWAGAVGCLILVVVSKRKETGLRAAFFGAIGWGLGGMMSYGVLVGYGKSSDFMNASYGLLSLFVVGGLYGFLGGGLFGLGLTDSDEKRVPWHQVAVELTVGGLIFYFFIIEQLGWRMTPPRSEAWGICAGAAFALAYFLYRTGNKNALRVAVFSGLGAGFGFGFGNFLQTLGRLSEVSFNFWNVMEYSLGFFGGIGMAYGALTSSWQPVKKQDKKSIWPIYGLAVLIPFFVWEQSFWEKDISAMLEKTAPEAMVFWETAIPTAAFVIWLGLVVFAWKNGKTLKNDLAASAFSILQGTCWVLFMAYLAYTFLITGSFMSVYRPEQFLYLVNFGLIWYLASKSSAQFQPGGIEGAGIWRLLFLILALMILLGAISSSLHEGMPGMQTRF
jgi:hypothetical protein